MATAPAFALETPVTASQPETTWQTRLLPFMVCTLALLTVLFCASLTFETISVQRHIESAHKLNLDPLLAKLDSASAAQSTSAVAEFRAKAATLLEANVIERRYHQASAAAIGRIYLIFLGFATGMVLALVGATFILGKIKEMETSIDGEAPSFKASVRSGSPGLILALLGTTLMLCTIFSRTEISVRDQALYLGPTGELGEFVTGRDQSASPPARTESPSELLRKDVKPLLKEEPKGGSAK